MPPAVHAPHAPSRAPWLLALAALTLLRLCAAAALPLSGDEAYYWTWSHALQGGYLDHPPMVALWMRTGTALAGETALGLRLLGPLSAAAGSVLLAQAAEGVRPGAGVPAAALFNGTLLLGAGAVTMTPDTPLVFFWTLALWALVRVLRTGQGGGGRWWLAAGAASGLALDSKYTAGFLGVGIALWLAWVPGLRRWFASPSLWAGGILAAALFAPVLAWNAGHGWASLLKQGGRAADWDPAGALRHLGELVAGQAGLATPLVFACLAAGTAVAVRGAVRRDPGLSLLAALTVPGLLVFVQHAVGDRVQANWPAILYPAAAAAAGAWAAGAGQGRWWRASAASGLALTALVTVQAIAAPLALPRRLDPGLIRLGGWDALARDADALRARSGAAFLAAENYGTASLLAWWTPGPVLAADPPGDAPRWSLLALPAAATPAPGLLLLSQRRREPPDPALWSQADPVGELVRARNGVEAERFRAYRVTPQPQAAFLRLPTPTKDR